MFRMARHLVWYKSRGHIEVGVFLVFLFSALLPTFLFRVLR